MIESFDRKRLAKILKTHLNKFGNSHGGYDEEDIEEINAIEADTGNDIYTYNENKTIDNESDTEADEEEEDEKLTIYDEADGNELFKDIIDRASGFLQRYNRVRYQILGKLFEPSLDINYINENYAGFSVLEGLNQTDFKKILKGDFFSSSEKCEEFINGNYFEIKNPDEFFYALARALEMEEFMLVYCFTFCDILNPAEYDRLFVYDVLDFYYLKSGLSADKLASLIKKKGFGSSTVGEILNGNVPITYEKFYPIACQLDIPEKLIKTCELKLAQKVSPLSYKAGYQDAMNDIIEHREELGREFFIKIADSDMAKEYENEINRLKQIIETYEALLPDYPHTLIHNLYRHRGFKFETCMNNQESSDYVPPFYKFEEMKVILPNGREKIIPTQDYEHILNKAIDFAEYLLVRKTLKNPNDIYEY